MLPYPTVNIAPYGDPLIRYPADKQGYVTQISLFILLNHIFFWNIFLYVCAFMS